MINKFGEIFCPTRINEETLPELLLNLEKIEGQFKSLNILNVYLNRKS